MKKKTQEYICMFPLALWFVLIPMIVKIKYYANPLINCSWYSSESHLADFFLYYKSVFVTITGVIMLVLLGWQISRMRRKETLFQADARMFISIIIYLVLAICSSLFSEYGYFCTHGMPDQFETIWNLLAYIIAMIYSYYVIVYQDSEKSLLSLIFVGAALVSVVCVLQYFKIDIYRLIYAGDGYSFTFEEGTVYGPFYNTNYVGFYTLLFVPLFILLAICYNDWKVRVLSGILSAALLISMVGAESITAEIALIIVGIFTILFLILKNITRKKGLWIPLIGIIVAGICACIILYPRINAYIQASDTEMTDLQHIYTDDDHVEIDYKGQKLYIQMWGNDDSISFALTDQDQKEVSSTYTYSDNGYYYYNITDDRFAGIALTPTILSEDPLMYGFMVYIDGKNWSFTNYGTPDGTYYYYTPLGKLTKLTADSVSADFTPLVNKSSLASGRGYIWNKTIALLRNYIFLGSGADTFALVYPNDDFVDMYNNGYDSMVITKPHCLYLQIAVQTGVVSLICFLIFYLWYLVSSLRLYFKQHLDNKLSITGFSIMLGTLGYMISGIANDSTITVAPLFWAMLGIGIGINHRLRCPDKQLNT